MPINLHGKQYVMVNERVEEAHKDQENISITSECISHDPVLFKATVVTKKGTFNGWSAADPNKTIEAKTPYEVAETSAVGRALGFAGYGIVESIASADEMNKGGYETKPSKPVQQAKPTQPTGLYCDYHKCEMKLNKNGKPYHRDGSRPEGDQFCNGRGFNAERELWKAKNDRDENEPDREPDYSSEDVAEDVPF